MNEYLTMRDLGRSFGMTSHQLGKALKDMGLRTADGKPSYAAFKGNYCAPHFAANGLNYCYAWHSSRVGELLEINGFPRKADHEIPFDAAAHERPIIADKR